VLSFDDAEECQTLTCETKAERALGTSQQCDDRMHPKSFRRQWPRRRVGRTAFLKTAKSLIESQDKSEVDPTLTQSLTSAPRATIQPSTEVASKVAKQTVS